MLERPDEGFYRTALNTLPIEASRTIYIDDIEANVEAGQKFGIESIRYDHRRHDDFLKRMADLGF